MRKGLRLVAVVVLVSLSATRVFATPKQTDDVRKDDVRKAVEGFATDWNHHDMDAFGKLFAPDAEFVNVTGVVMQGRERIQMHHAWAHGAIPKTTEVPGTLARNYGIFKNSTMKFDAIDVRFLRSDVALAHVSWQLLRDSRTTTPRRGMLLFVLTHGKDGWLIASGQNTEINRTVK